MNKRQIFTGVLIGLLFLIILTAGFATILPAQAAELDDDGCVRQKHVQNWTNETQLQAHGFFVDTISPQSSLSFAENDLYKYLRLEIDPTPNFAGEYVASRITEIDTSVPVNQRVKCWQPTASEDVVVETVIRFEQAMPPFGLTENVFLWNAPFGENPIPITAIGVTRSLDLATFQPAYSALVSQDLTIFPEFSGLLINEPMPGWLDASDWHSIRITVSETGALIEVAQNEHPYTPVLQTSLMHPPQPLGFEFSVDNEVLPGTLAPVVVPDSLDVGYFDIRLVR